MHDRLLRVNQRQLIIREKAHHANERMRGQHVWFGNGRVPGKIVRCGHQNTTHMTQGSHNETTLARMSKS